jgi:hypothetical protein
MPDCATTKTKLLQIKAQITPLLCCVTYKSVMSVDCLHVPQDKDWWP